MKTPLGQTGPDHATRLAQMRLLEEGCDSHHLREAVVAVGPGHRLFVATPKGTAPAAGWPILYLMDGNAAFDALSPDMLAATPGLMIAAVGYDTDRQFSRTRRTLDFTAPDPAAPGADAEGLRPDPVHEGRIAGGAGLFLQRLVGPLRAAAEAEAPVDPARRTLWGHSFGGLFTLYALLAQPQHFARYAAISPSIWWDEALMRRTAAAAAPVSSTAPAPSLLVALGDHEHRSGSDAPFVIGPAPATMAFVHDLAKHPGITADLYVLQGLKHIETLPASLPLALKLASD